jgi:chloramphenicol-sensitive protein RarD
VPADDAKTNSTALAAGIACYLIWGFVPLVFQAIGRQGVGSWEILAHRTLWAAPTAFVFVLMARQGRQAAGVLRNPRALGWLVVSTALIAANWSVYIWSVNSGRVLESSLGYYITPLINMAAGALIFRERIDRIGGVAIGLAGLGVAVQTAALGHLPLVSLTLAFSFGFYGVVRKQMTTDAQTGLFFECLLLSIPGLAYVLWLEGQGANHFTASGVTAAWLVASGPITAIPLLLFAWAARRIPLSLMGFLQFLAPSIAFFIGVAQGEPFTPLRALSFAFIWGGAAVFTYGAWRRSRMVAAAAQPAE